MFVPDTIIKQKYNTQNIFLSIHFTIYINIELNILKYTAKRMRVFNIFSKKDIKDIKIDFTLILAACNKSI